MDHHDLARLSHEEFEEVCRDLFSEILGIRLEIFAPAADGGVDLRGTGPDGETVAVQCKHWWRTPAASLAAHVARSELPKVRELDPARYVLATSCDLTVAAKDRLYETLRDYARDPADIYGVREIAAELRARPHVVRRHPRLWFHSAEALSAVTRKELFERSRDLADDIRQSLTVFVPGRSYLAARELLDRHHVCLVSGLPGQGKTTLAHALAAAHAALGYEVVAVSEDTADVDASWADDRPQLFLYDDFLGRTALERRRHGGSARLVRLVERVTRAADKRLLLTTREYVLAQASDADELLHDAPIHQLKCAVEFDEYDPARREAIVRNHLAAAALDDETKAAVMAPATLRALAAHPHFSPRQVALSIRAAVHLPATAGRLADDLLANLDDPLRLWTRIVEHHLDDAATDLLAVLFSFGEPTRREHLLRAWTTFRRHLGRSAEGREFRGALRVLDGTMIRATLPDGVRGQEHDIGTHNPSVDDFLIAYFGGPEEEATLRALLDSAAYFQQSAGIWDSLVGFGGPVPEAVAAVADALGDAMRRTVAGPVSHPAWDGHFYRLATVADVVAELPRLRPVLDEQLGRVPVVFESGADEEDETGLALLVDTMLQYPGAFEEDLVRLLLPAIERIAPGDTDAVFGLGQLLAERSELPASILDAADERIHAELERMVAAGVPDDLDRAWQVAEAAAARGLRVPSVLGAWLEEDETDDAGEGPGGGVG